MSVWRDEAHGKPDADVQFSEEEQAADEQDQEMVTDHAPEQPTDVVHSTPPSSRAPSHPPTSDMESEPNNAVDDIPDADMDAMIQEYASGPQGDDMGQDPNSLEEYFTSLAPPPDPKTGVVNSDLPLTDNTGAASLPHEEEEDWGEDMYI